MDSTGSTTGGEGAPLPGRWNWTWIHGSAFGGTCPSAPSHALSRFDRYGPATGGGPFYVCQKCREMLLKAAQAHVKAVGYALFTFRPTAFILRKRPWWLWRAIRASAWIRCASHQIFCTLLQSAVVLGVLHAGSLLFRRWLWRRRRLDDWTGVL